MIPPERIQGLNDAPIRSGRYVLYWMQASQRARCNHALEYAIRQANERKQPLVALFGLTDRYPEAQERHYAFLLEGLRETQQVLRERGVNLLVRRESPEIAAVRLAADASLVVTDRGYTRLQKAWRHDVAAGAACRVVQVESDVIVPVQVASDKREYSAATLRPKIHRQLSKYLVPLEATPLVRSLLDVPMESWPIEDVDAALADLRIDRTAGRVRAFTGGASQANRWLTAFIERKLRRYATERNDPGLDIQSHQSPYLHFGQVGALEIALAIQAARGVSREARDGYLEELIVRRELAINFVHYESHYDAYGSLPAWARRCLAAHGADPRPVTYSAAQLERAATADPYWNAAMREMLITGKMHNYMRMYWGKKILEWTRDPRRAFRGLLTLNNRYFLDGRDPSSFANVAWCFGLHDRPWGERAIFGQVRYMNAAGLERKFDMGAYLRYVEALS
jgi:deoxyribodipyrimidine photo-lyase